ncbi:MAG TPA: GT4 family glycosyltransferase PelF [Alphaproteobacteria bacterium]|nr:GT4 family glycosyltransferase PelF [Alphaproteobacteria bacterium]
MAMLAPANANSSAEVADVCLLLEGTYPYVAGGVSSWVNDLVHAHKGLTFRILALLADRQKREYRYTVPANVLSIENVYLQDPPKGRRLLWGERRLIRRLEEPLQRLTRFGGIDELREILRTLGRRRDHLGPRLLLNSPAAWDLLCRTYDRSLPGASFIDFFWTWRALIGGLFAGLTAPLPTARCYHAVSTGYAGLLLARAKLETGRPTLLTEHGIYTNERRVEIAMADWLFESGASGLQVETRQRDLRDLWIDTFVSYSRACYAASDRIITLYGGNQELQIRDGADPARLEVIPNGIDYDRFAKVQRVTEGRRPTVALIGRVVPIKDVKTFIRACAALQRAVPDLEALIMGPTDEDPGYYAECERMVAQLNLTGTVTFTGRVKLEDYLGRIDAIALTSISEAQPLVLLEAGAAGVPSVATDVGACREMIEGRTPEDRALGLGGAITALSSPAETARALAALLTDRDHGRRCGLAMQERVRRFYNKTDLDRTYAALYDAARTAPDGPVEV